LKFPDAAAPYLTGQPSQTDHAQGYQIEDFCVCHEVAVTANVTS
jgi:hypothetical protein